MPINKELRKQRDKRYEEKQKENKAKILIRIDKELKSKLKKEIEEDCRYSDMSDFIIKCIKEYVNYKKI